LVRAAFVSATKAVSFKFKKYKNMPQVINVVLFGIGNTGSALINKVVKSSRNAQPNTTQLRFPVITNSTVAFFEKEGADYAWEANFIQFAIPFKLDDVIEYVLDNDLQNLIAVDATPSAALAAEYAGLLRTGFSIVSINESLPFLPDSFEKGIKFLADSRGLAHRFIRTGFQDKEAAADAIHAAILEVAGKIKEVA
jgi:homoserine dehydrogenase/aspartokinase/homoserine dehydrogenase 1